MLHEVTAMGLIDKFRHIYRTACEQGIPPEDITIALTYVERSMLVQFFIPYMSGINPCKVPTSGLLHGIRFNAKGAVDVPNQD